MVTFACRWRGKRVLASWQRYTIPRRDIYTRITLTRAEIENAPTGAFVAAIRREVELARREIEQELTRMMAHDGRRRGMTAPTITNQPGQVIEWRGNDGLTAAMGGINGMPWDAHERWGWTQAQLGNMGGLGGNLADLQQ